MNRELIVAPIMVVGLLYSLAIMFTVHRKMWYIAAFLFCYGIALLGARLAQLISRLK